MNAAVHSRSRMVVTEVPITPATTRRAGRAMMAAVRGLHPVPAAQECIECGRPLGSPFDRPDKGMCWHCWGACHE